MFGLPVLAAIAALYLLIVCSLIVLDSKRAIGIVTTGNEEGSSFIHYEYSVDNRLFAGSGSTHERLTSGADVQVTYSRILPRLSVLNVASLLRRTLIVMVIASVFVALGIKLFRVDLRKFSLPQDSPTTDVGGDILKF